MGSGRAAHGGAQWCLGPLRSNGMSSRALYLAIGALFGVWLVLGARYDMQLAHVPQAVSENTEIPPTTPLTQLKDARLMRYCSPAVSSGAEGLRPAALAESGLQLRSVVLTIRHGDRSAIFEVAGSLPPAGGQGYSCAPGNLSSLWKNLPKRFRAISTAEGQPLREEMLRPKLKEGSSLASECAPGQLTARGFRQHLELGAHLNGAYREFLAALQRHDRGRLYVRSTDYPRTVTSAAALLTSLLPTWSDRIDIEVHEEESAEVMHGVGLKTSSKAGDGKAERIERGTCKAAVRHSAAQFDAWRQPVEEYAQLERLFGPVARTHAVCDFADSMYAATCHALPLPCGPGGCVQPELANAVAQRADEFYCERFSGSEGGEVATSLAFYPFLRELLSLLKEATTLDAAPSLAVFSGHDTVIAPLLSALGAYHRFCEWPSYASRIAFELYSRPMSKAHVVFYVRVLFNGEQLYGLRGCPEGEELCELEDFARGVESLLGGAPDLRAACEA
ncbi:unnamed protein product [Polarella glacialis]|uniref:Acid phosphatase n=2 Tax=Polarella glacialis TaxID=89957 RepID=A0A813K5C1_POLGL|nr:unnamed protein product [Polarella glacialis]